MASPSSIREFRFQVGTTFRTSHVNAGDANSWNITNGPCVHKLRVISCDVSGLTQPGIEDETLQTRMHARPAMISGMSKGNLKVGTYAGGAYANVDVGPEWNIAQAMAGGIQAPTTTRTGTAGAAVSTINVAYTGVSGIAVTGMAALLGSRGDAKGGGEVCPINAVTADNFEIKVATAGAVDTDDAVTFSTTLYPDEDATQRFIDTLVIGHASADQIQTIGGAGSFTITGTSVGEVPKLDFDIACADWQYQPSGSRASLNYANVPRGGNPSFDKGIGRVHIGDRDAGTRTAYKVTDVTFNPGLSYAEVPSCSGVNGVGSHQHMPGAPTLECTILTAEDDGLLDDYPDTAKMVLVQIGHEATKCIAIELPCAYLDEKPTRVEVNNLTGWKLKFHGTENYVSGSDLQSAAWRVHIF